MCVLLEYFQQDSLPWK